MFIGKTFPVDITNSHINLNIQADVIIVPAGSTRNRVRGTRLTEVKVQELAQNAAGKSGLSTPVTIGNAQGKTQPVNN